MIVSAAVALTGTAVLFSGIPAGTKQLIVSVTGMSLSASDGLRIRFGTSAGIVTTGYDSQYQTLTLTQVSLGSVVGFDSYALPDPSQNIQMSMMLADPVNNIWVGALHGASRGNARNWQLYGRVALPGVLDRVQISLTGASSFTAGKVNYLAS